MYFGGYVSWVESGFYIMPLLGFGCVKNTVDPRCNISGKGLGFVTQVPENYGTI